MTFPLGEGELVPTVSARQFETEKEFSQAVVDLARLKGWTVWRTFDSRRSPAGEPDLRLFHPTKKPMLWRELKVGKNKLSQAQRTAHVVLDIAGQDVAVWRPENWAEIIKELS